MIRPSSFPALQACSRFVSGVGGEEQKNAGTARHVELAKRLLGVAPTPMESDEDEDGVAWALNVIQCNAPIGGDWIRNVEIRLSYTDENFDEIYGGTPDYFTVSESEQLAYLFDLKWRRADYRAQMAAYVLCIFQTYGVSKVNVQILFADAKAIESFSLTKEQAEAIVLPIVNAAKNPGEPTPNSHCNRCANLATCKPYIDAANAVAKARTDFGVEEFHSSKIETAEEMGKALKLAKRVCKWAEAVEFQAKELALKQGIIAEGFKLQTRQGTRVIESVTAAFGAAGLPQDEFLKACEIKFSSLVEAQKNFHGMKKAQAERDVETRLGSLIQRKPSTQSLVEEKEENEQ